MKPAPFEQTPEFQNFADVMKRIIKVPKAEMDQKLKDEVEAKTRNT